MPSLCEDQRLECLPSAGMERLSAEPEEQRAGRASARASGGRMPNALVSSRGACARVARPALAA
jgi:hypothetical protein